MPGEEIIPARGKNHSTARLSRCVQRLLKRGGVIRFAVSLGAEVQ